ncbi:MAG: hypothetical protein [Wendovervirus sonii]|uniref:DUF1848 domain-containing protein n=1 Tax=phage Lak_Megaphage_Sonny TaxID=3109229 RepID=A0ABZ0Z3T4_9CAUD|nr:MAG: hypothetical protein [phage Lak_Megaphage_Sonny]
MANKINIQIDTGEFVEANSPFIISASRSTDIPAFYSDWFFNRLEKGYSAWTNPFNNVKSYVSYINTKFIVFWSKNPKPLLEHIDKLNEKHIGCYIQYTLNDYVTEGLETNVSSIDDRIDTFKRLVDKIGYNGVIWRFDPLILTDKINENSLIEKISNIGNKLKEYTEKMVFSFADIEKYPRVVNNLKNANIHYKEWSAHEMQEFGEKLVNLNKSEGWNYELATCGEAAKIPGIIHNKCIDDNLIIRRTYNDNELMDYLKVKFYDPSETDLFGDPILIPDNAIKLDNGKYAVSGASKDGGQRLFCGCIDSKDIGQYNTCVHGCAYCYANTGKSLAAANYKKYLTCKNKDSIC